VRRSDCESVTLREEFVGRFSLGSRFPQYLITAILTGAVVLAVWMVEVKGELEGRAWSLERRGDEG
jgi:hypothetical protein